MHHYDYRTDTNVGRVCFELSLKPFGYDKSPAGCEAVARELFTKWNPLLRFASGCAVLLWTSDGSEILEYTGKMEDEFDWCRYIGIGNWDRSYDHTQPKPDNYYSLHRFPILYTENPPKMTYGDLKNIIDALKKIGHEMTGFDVEVGETFDPGPEFAYSYFKYERHPEISTGSIMGAKKWVHCASRLHAEDKAYAAYPAGIPEGTHLGEFLGRQFMAMKRDLGFDYIWLSNGFGFSLQSWNWTGELFDGEKFDFAGAQRIRDNISEFWRYFTAELGDTRIECRGSNLSTGMDISAHGCPIDEIYAQKTLVSPPNSPWAALNSQFGLELTGYMSHIAEIPEKGYAFRYYTHDPWWLNSPWFDRYNRSPHDIYLPLSVARLDADCGVTKPWALDFLSIDDSFGQMPDRCNNEVIPHLLTAFDDYPDEAGLLTWVYPFDEYCRIGLREGRMERLIMDDWFIESAIAYGFPLSSVISDRNFIAADKKKLLKTILVTPVPEAGSALEDALIDALAQGGRVILYGSTECASERLREMIGVKLSDGIEGRLTVTTSLALDTAETGGYASSLEHHSYISGGALREVALRTENMYASAEKDGEVRAYAMFNPEKQLAWVRGSFPHHSRSKGHLPAVRNPREDFVPSILMRAVMQLFGYPMRYEAFELSSNMPLILFSRCRGAMYMSSFVKDSTIKLTMSTPDGAPAPNGMDFIIEDSVGTYPLAKWAHTDCRIFVKQKKRACIRCRRDCFVAYRGIDEKFVIEGLNDAEISFYTTENGTVYPRVVAAGSNTGDMFLEPNVDYYFDKTRGCWVILHVTGNLHIGWQAAENKDELLHLEFLRK